MVGSGERGMSHIPFFSFAIATEGEGKFWGVLIFCVASMQFLTGGYRPCSTLYRACQRRLI